MGVTVSTWVLQSGNGVLQCRREYCKVATGCYSVDVSIAKWQRGVTVSTWVLQSGNGVLSTVTTGESSRSGRWRLAGFKRNLPTTSSSPSSCAWWLAWRSMSPPVPRLAPRQVWVENRSCSDPLAASLLSREPLWPEEAVRMRTWESGPNRSAIGCSSAWRCGGGLLPDILLCSICIRAKPSLWKLFSARGKYARRLAVHTLCLSDPCFWTRGPRYFWIAYNYGEQITPLHVVYITEFSHHAFLWSSEFQLPGSTPLVEPHDRHSCAWSGFQFAMLALGGHPSLRELHHKHQVHLGQWIMHSDVGKLRNSGNFYVWTHTCLSFQIV